MPHDKDTPAAKAARKAAALAELKRLVKEQRSRLDPEVLSRVAEKLGPAAKGPATNSALPADSLPYDRAAATKAIELFIASHKDKADFTARLMSFMKKQSH